MKVWIVWASNGESYEDNYQDIWAVCDSKEAAEQCIANAREQIRRDEERLIELAKISGTRENTYEEVRELDQILDRDYCRSRKNDGLPYFSIREYEMTY